MPTKTFNVRDQFYADLRGDYAHRYKTYDPLAMQLLYELLQIMTATEQRCQSRVHAKGLTMPGLNVLTILRKHGAGGCALNVISQLLLVSQANVTGLVDSLARKGLVVRENHATDRRVTLAKITQAGTAFLDAYLPGHYATLCGTVAGLSKREKHLLIGLLSKLRQTSATDQRQKSSKGRPSDAK